MCKKNAIADAIADARSNVVAAFGLNAKETVKSAAMRELADLNAVAKWAIAGDAPHSVRSTARCKCCKQHNHTDSVPCYTANTGNAIRYYHAECWGELTPTDAARAVKACKPNNTGCKYNVTLTCNGGASGLAHASLIDVEGAPMWYRTGANTYESPTYMAFKWWDKLGSIIELVESGSLKIEIAQYDGTPVDTIEYRWGNRNELGRFTTPIVGDATQIHLDVDEATYPIKGYRNWNVDGSHN